MGSSLDRSICFLLPIQRGGGGGSRPRWGGPPHPGAPVPQCLRKLALLFLNRVPVKQLSRLSVLPFLLPCSAAEEIRVSHCILR